MTLIEFIMVFGAGWFFGQIYFAWKMHREMQKVAKKLGLDIEGMTAEINNAIIISNKPIIPELFTEYLNNSIILYNKNTGAFICQAESLEDLAKCAKDFNNIDTAIVEDKEKIVFFVDGKIQTNINEN